MTRPVVLVPHDPAWTRLAADEATLVAGILGAELQSIHHIGSTSIPGIKAKPILDLLGVVRQLRFLDENTHLFERIGYRPRGEMGVPGRRYFSQPPEGTRTHHLHLFQQGDPNIDRHLRFRDYLLAHREVAVAYEHLKERLAAWFSNDSAAYTEAKTDFVQEVERKAAEQDGSASA